MEFCLKLINVSVSKILMVTCSLDTCWLSGALRCSDVMTTRTGGMWIDVQLPSQYDIKPNRRSKCCSQAASFLNAARVLSNFRCFLNLLLLICVCLKLQSSSQGH